MVMRYGAAHVEHDQPLPEVPASAYACAHLTHCGKKIHKQIARPGWHPTARDDLNLSTCHVTAQRSVAHKGARVSAAIDTLLHDALRYAHAGVKVFPLWWAIDGQCVCSDGADCSSPGKHPRLGPGGCNRASANPDQALDWWHRWPRANIGLAAGANGLAIIDVDPGKGGDDTLATLINYCDERGVDLMATRLVHTGSGGLHLYFRQPPGGIKTGAKTFGSAGVDTRGRGGYVVAPPSVHASGQRYEFIDNGHARAASWPDILTPLMDAPRPPERPVPDGTGPAHTRATSGGDAARQWAAAGLQAECQALMAMTTPNSGRNQALNNAAYKMGRRVGAGLLDEAHALESLVAAASRWSGHTARSIEATVRSGLAAGRKRPHTGPAPRGQS